MGADPADTSGGRSPARASAARVRPMTLADLDRVADLEARCFDNPGARASLAAELARSWARILVLEDEAHGIVAFVDYWRVADEVHVLNVATEPALRRRGYGRVLMEAVMAASRAEGVVTVLLEVRPSNTAAVALYTSFGFEVTATRRGYYDDGEDAWVMASTRVG